MAHKPQQLPSLKPPPPLPAVFFWLEALFCLYMYVCINNQHQRDHHSHP